MKHDIINMFEDILAEVNWAAERDSQIEQSRSSKAHSKDNQAIKASKNEDEDEVGDEEADEEAGDVSSSDNKLDDLKIEDALKYSKLKRCINKFRSSHSINDPDVNEELEKFFNKLEKSEKKMLYVLLHGLTQVTLLDISGESAYTPQDHGLEVVKKSQASKEKISAKEKEQKLSIDASEEEVKQLTNSPITAIKVGGV